MAKGRERSGKWYFKNEKEVMLDLGLTPTKGSGSGWVDKEDGHNDFVLAQLKSTDKTSYQVKQLDLEKLEYNASVSSKIPMFIVQFLNKDTRYALMALDDIPLIAEYIKTGQINKAQLEPPITLEATPKKQSKPKIQSSKKAREAFNKAKEKAWEDRKWKGK